MNRLFQQYDKNTLARDFMASVVVFLVALPLCLGIAIASGVPPAVGLLTGIVGGLIVGFLAGCPLQVSGPAAGLVAIVWEIVQTHGLEGLGVIVLLAGLMQIGAGLLNLGPWFRAVSPAVIHGMLAGIGVVIAASQFHVMLDDVPKGSALTNLQSIPDAIVKGLFPMDGSSHHIAAAIGVLTILMLLIWNVCPVSRLKAVPGPLVAVLTAVFVAALFDLPIKYIDIPADMAAVLRFPSWDTMTLLANSDIWVAAATIALVASIETLLTATAVDQMQSRTQTQYNREMLAQGVGNTICGFLGALPMTGVIVRSAANVNAGAKTRLSTMLHGLWLLLFVLFCPFLLERIPTASLAAILVYTGYKLVNPRVVKNLLQYGKSEVAIYVVTMIAIVMTNLLEGIVIGVLLSALKLMHRFSFLQVQFVKDPFLPQATIVLNGSATFFNIPKLASVLEQIPDGLEVRVHFEALRYIDHACLDFLMNWEKRYAARGGSLVIEWHELTARFHASRHAAPEPTAADPSIQG